MLLQEEVLLLTCCCCMQKLGCPWYLSGARLRLPSPASRVPGQLGWEAAGASAAGSSALEAGVEQYSSEKMLLLCVFLATFLCLSFPSSVLYWAVGGLCSALLWCPGQWRYLGALDMLLSCRRGESSSLLPTLACVCVCWCSPCP